MVQLTITAAAKTAIDEYCRLKTLDQIHPDTSWKERQEKLLNLNVGNPVDHHELIEVSRYLVQRHGDSDPLARQWRLHCLLRGTLVYHPPPPPKPEPTPEYQTLMRRLREQEEQRQYDLMLNPLPKAETFGQRFPTASPPHGLIGSDTVGEADEVSYADINRQMILIINVLVSIVCCSIAIWLAARRWSVPQRLGLSFSGSTIVAVAEVAIYLGYIKRIKDAKLQEVKKVERKEVIDTWVIDAKPIRQPPISVGLLTSAPGDSLRLRNTKHR